MVSIVSKVVSHARKNILAIKITCSIKEFISSLLFFKKKKLSRYREKSRSIAHKPWILLHFTNTRSFLLGVCFGFFSLLVTSFWKWLGYSGINLFKMSASAWEDYLFGCFLLLAILKNFCRRFINLLRLSQLWRRISNLEMKWHW